MEKRMTLTNLTGCALGLAALIAASALLVFALVFAGMIRPDWMATMGPGMGPMMGLGPGGNRAAATVAADGSSATGTPLAGGDGGAVVGGGQGDVSSAAGATTGTATAASLGARGPAATMPASAARAGAETSGPATARAAGGTVTPSLPLELAFTPDAPPGPAKSGAALATEIATTGRPARIVASRVVEDWTGYDGDDAPLADAFSVNLGWADNALDLSLLDAAGFYAGQPGVTAAFTITAPAPNDYVGFERDLEAMEDWSGYSHLSLLIDPGPPTQAGRLVLQWYEATGEVWTHATPLADIAGDGPVTLRVPLTPEAWTWADWSDKRNQRIDLPMVTRFGLFIGHGGPMAGTIRLGPLQVIRTAE